MLRGAFERGLVLLPAGESVIRVSPPLVIERSDIDAGIGIIGRVLEEINGG